MSSGARLWTEAGERIPLHVDRWFAAPEAAEESVLDRAIPPVLDVGCGPARHVLALTRRGVPVLGLDVSAEAARIATARGAGVLRRSVFDPLPGEGRWGSVLLLDGNVGIGGHPEALFARLARLLRGGGRLLAELDPPGTPTGPIEVAVEVAGRRGRWFSWARVGVDGLEGVAAATGFRTQEVWSDQRRWFACLEGSP